MKQYPLTIQAGAQATLSVSGARFLWMRESAAAVRVSVTGQGSEVADLVMVEGDDFTTARGFDKVRISNESGATIAVVLVVGDGNASTRALVGNITTSRAATIVSGVVLSHSGGVTVAAANTARREVIITNKSANTDTVWIGAVGLALSQGIELLPGASVTLDGTYAVGAISASNQNVTVVQVLD